MSYPPEQPAPDVTRLLIAWRDGDAEAIDRLFPLVYRELRSLAEGYLHRERPDHTLEPTAVLHEAYMRLVDRTHPRWESRVHFFAVTAQIMRRVLVDHARRRQANKRGAGAVHIPLDEELAASIGEGDGAVMPDILTLDAALDALAAVDARKSRAVELRYFGGLTNAEVAATLGVSVATVRLDLRLARVWLAREIRRGSIS